MPRLTRAAAILMTTACLALAGAALGQSDDEARAAAREETPGEFQFVRLAYSTNRFMNYGGRRQAWQTDHPDAEHHSIDTAEPPGVRTSSPRTTAPVESRVS